MRTLSMNGKFLSIEAMKFFKIEENKNFKKF